MLQQIQFHQANLCVTILVFFKWGSSTKVFKVGKVGKKVNLSHQFSKSNSSFLEGSVSIIEHWQDEIKPHSLD